MRPVQELGFAPLAEPDRQAMLEEHILYRVDLLNDAKNRIPAQNQQDNQAFEAGAVSGRILLSFLGVGYDEKNCRLKEDRQHKVADGVTDDVKVRDVGGDFVEIANLSLDDKGTLIKFIRGAHKACAHFTINSGHQLSPETYKQVVPIIIRLLRESLPNLHL